MTILPRSDEWKKRHWQRKPCLRTTRPLSPTGYGICGVKRFGVTVYRAHRLAWIDYHHRLPPVDRPYILHLCIGHRWCEEPTHLYAGTQFDNMTDRSTQGHFDHHGERNPRAKLTVEQVAKIREEYVPRSRHANTRTLAQKYNMDQSTIARIVNNTYWSH